MYLHGHMVGHYSFSASQIDEMRKKLLILSAEYEKLKQITMGKRKQ